MTDVASQLGAWALAQTGWTGLLLALAVVADIALCRRVAAAWRIWLYVAVLVRLALPATWASPIGIGDSLAAGKLTQVATLIQTSEAGVPAVGGSMPTSVGSQAVATTTRAAPAAVSALVAVYLLGVGIAAVRLATGVRAARRLRKESVSAARTVDGVAYLVHELFGPAVVGVLRPRIIVPCGLEKRGEALRAVLVHERAHVDRHDPLLAFGLHAVCAIFWPIAPVWIAAARIRALMEQACDDRVLARGIDRVEYGRVLLDAAERAGLWRGAAVANALPFGAGVKGRIVAMCRRRRWKRGVQAGVVLGFAALAIACSGEKPSKNQADRDVSDKVTTATAAASESEGTTIELEMRILDAVAENPKLKWDSTQPAMQGATGSDQCDRVPILSDLPIIGALFVTETVTDPAHALTAAELASLLAEPGVSVRAAPRLLLRPAATGTVEVGESRDGKLVKGFTLTIHAMPRAAGTAVTMQYQETGVDKLELAESFKTTLVTAGQTQAFLARSVSGTTQRVILVTPTVRPSVPAGAPPDAADSGAYINSMEYPKVLAMLHIAQLGEFVPFEAITLPAGPADSRADMVILGDAGKQGTVIMNAKTSPANAQVPTGWARLVSAAGLNTAEEQLARRAGYAHLASPAMITKPGEWASIETSGTDKAGAVIGSRVEAMITADGKDGGVRLSLRWRKAGGEAITSADNLPIDAGRVLMVLIPPEKSGGVYRVLSVNPRLINGPADYPAQTMSIPEGAR